jgi:hypothetical protein
MWIYEIIALLVVIKDDLNSIGIQYYGIEMKRR